MDLSRADCKLSDIVEQDSANASKVDSTATVSSRAAAVRSNLRVTTAPRIDISRASSSSQHDDSRDSSPENVFEQVGTGTLQESGEELGFTEDGATEMRSSTEELNLNEADRPKERAEVDIQQVSEHKTHRMTRQNESANCFPSRPKIDAQVAGAISIR